jgi:hypothetical protein
MQSSFLSTLVFLFLSVFQCELHLILNSFLTRIIALYQNLKQSISCWYTLEHKLNFSVVLLFFRPTKRITMPKPL